MRLIRQLQRGWRVLTQRAAADDELNDELRHFYEEEVASLVAGGLSPAAARRQARLSLGEASNVAEEVRAGGWESKAEAIVIDLRYAVRRLWHSPGFTVVCVVTLALSIGASTAIFSAVKPILFDRLPYPGADRIVTIADRSTAGPPIDVTFASYRELLQRTRSFAALAVSRPWQPTLTGGEQPERLEAQRVSASYFRVFGVAPVLGRDFAEAEDVVRGPFVAIISHGLWQRRFGSDRNIVGRTIALNDYAFTVVGVLPASFENVLGEAVDVWTPLQYDASLPSAEGREWGHHLRLVGRLAEGVEQAAATRELNRIAATPLPEFVRMPWANMARGMIVSSLRDDLSRGIREALFAVMGAVLLLLLIAGVNVTNLLLTRGAQRSGELTLRAALGAGRNRLVAQLLVETMVLAWLGAALAMVVALFGVRALVALSPPELPRVSAIEIDTGVFAFAFAVATAVGCLVGIVVALRASGPKLGTALQQSTRRVTGSDQRTRAVLVVAQVALAVVLLVSGGLLLRSLNRLFAVHPGFDAAQVVTMKVQVTGQRYGDDPAIHQFFTQALEAVRAVPGVTSAAFTSLLPLSDDDETYGVQFESAPGLTPDDDGSGFRYAVTPDYFGTMRIPLRQGRLLDARDVAGAPPVAVINESFARWRLQGENPIGKRIRVGTADQPWTTIVGVVGDVKQLSLAVDNANAVYLPNVQGYFVDRTLSLVARVRGDADALAASVRDAIWSVDRDQAIWRITTMERLVTRSAAERRFTLVILDAFAIVALVLAAIGLYGVLASGVSARTREIGIRSALGASSGSILRMIVRHGFLLTGAGLALGMAGAVAASRAIRSMLFGITHVDAITYAGVLLLMLLVCAAACGLPARRALRVEPTTALRAE